MLNCVLFKINWRLVWKMFKIISDFFQTKRKLSVNLLFKSMFEVLKIEVVVSVCFKQTKLTNIRIFNVLPLTEDHWIKTKTFNKQNIKFGKLYLNNNFLYFKEIFFSTLTNKNIHVDTVKCVISGYFWKMITGKWKLRQQPLTKQFNQQYT